GGCTSSVEPASPARICELPEGLAMWTVLPQLLLLGGIAVVVALPLTGANRFWRLRRVMMVAIVLALVGGAMLLLASRWPFAGASPALADLVPGRRVEGGYVSSQACRKCH